MSKQTWRRKGPVSTGTLERDILAAIAGATLISLEGIRDAAGISPRVPNMTLYPILAGLRAAGRIETVAGEDGTLYRGR